MTYESDGGETRPRYELQCFVELVLEHAQKATEKAPADSASPRDTGTDLMRSLQAYISMMAPHQKERPGGRLLLAAAVENDRLLKLCVNVHDRLLRGEKDSQLLVRLAEAWQGPNARPDAGRETGAP